MPRKRKEEDSIPTHQHSFNPTFEEGISKCACGAEDLSPQVMEARSKAWDNYKEMVLKSEPYFDFLLAKAAFRDSDIKTVKEIAQRATERQQKKQYLPKPPFRDPRW